MPRSALLAGTITAILSVAVPEAGATLQMPITPDFAGARANSAIHPAIVMFDLAIVRMRMLNTLTELIRSGERVLAARRW